MKNIIFILLIGSLFFSCQHKSKKTDYTPKLNEKEINKIHQTIDVDILRYDKALFSLDRSQVTNELLKLQKDYSFFIRENPTTSENIERLLTFMNDNLNQELYKDVQKQFPDLSSMEKDFNSAFTLIKYHFPQAVIPKIYSAILGLSYEYPIIYEDSVLVIALDMYLGSNYKNYKRLGNLVPHFIIRRFTKEYILRDCMKIISYDYIKFDKNATTLLDEMIFEGKRWMFAELMLPSTHDSIIAGYSLEKLQWTQNNELNIWTYLIDKEYLYSNDNILIRKFIYDAPFTATFGNVSPGQIGAWLGWQICRSWIKQNPEKKISELMTETNAQKILKESKYKPKKGN
ncbi:MAG: hypothetical protein KBA86_07775 [Bacteroidales bacterium]|nr:hypothetical protein [Bacteroidales bacterium]